MESYAHQRCRTLCWVASALFGLFAIWTMRHYWDVSFLKALVVGLVVFFGLGWLIPKFACPSAEIQLPVRRMPAPVHVQPKPVEAEPVKTAPKAEAVAAVKVAEVKAPPVKAAPKKAAPKAKAEPVKAKAAAKEKAEPPKVVAAPKAAKPSAPSKPAGLDAARDGKPDDLKVIVGVGPKLEVLLNKLGYFHFDQIAAWKAAEVAWVDENLEGFKGRVTRDKWVAQAKKLAKG